MLGLLAAGALSITCLAAFAKRRAFFARVRPEFRTTAPAGLSTLAPNPSARWIVTGMMGSGKSTLARSLAAYWEVPHLQIDYLSDAQVLAAVHPDKPGQGWIAEANPWQVPVEVWERAETIVFLDYDNVVNYVRLLRRALSRWRSSGLSWQGFRHHVFDYALRTLCRIVYLHGEDNRKAWRDRVVAPTEARTDRASLVRCVSPAEAKLLIEKCRARTLPGESRE